MLTVESDPVRGWLPCEERGAGEWVQWVLLRGCVHSLGRRGQWLHLEKWRKRWPRQSGGDPKPWAWWWMSREGGIQSWDLAFDVKCLFYWGVNTHSVLKWKRKKKKAATRGLGILASFQKVSVHKSPFQLRICCKIHSWMIVVAGKYVHISARSNEIQAGICSFIFFWQVCKIFTDIHCNYVQRE